MSKRERKAPLACLAQDRGEAIRRKVLKLVGIEGEVAAILLRDVGAALGSLGGMRLGRIDLGVPNRQGSDSTGWLERRPAGMARPLSMDLRRAVAAPLEGGRSRHLVAARFRVAPSTVINWIRRFQATGSVAPGQIGGHKPKAIAGEHHVFLGQRIRDRDHPARACGRTFARPQGRLSIGVEVCSRRDAQL